MLVLLFINDQRGLKSYQQRSEIRFIFLKSGFSSTATEGEQIKCGKNEFKEIYLF
jgi:hypothetical protein